MASVRFETASWSCEFVSRSCQAVGTSISKLSNIDVEEHALRTSAISLSFALNSSLIYT